ncbi:hypothetical protein V7O66_03890 [Methanolobus sp. ZRKC3]|uniref:hypothetical protein n=1 Tax=Methanolobus sp. ZRKC3 TaxID=3125786 RepID=UPI003247A2DA
MIDEMSKSEGFMGPIQNMIKNKGEGFLLAGRFCLKDKVDDIFFSDIIACYEIDLLPGDMGIIIEERNKFGASNDMTLITMSQICGFKLSYEKPAVVPGEGISIDL